MSKSDADKIVFIMNKHEQANGINTVTVNGKVKHITELDDITLCLESSRQPDGCGLSWPEITVIKTNNIIVFQVVIWPVQLNPENENPPLKEANSPAMS
ncbi:hypothetical protein [Escherichia coli]|uniref:hypothetical protein n=1 Tax=Escherichia coli TaxID=562 RepID=UPI0018E4111C|nr:hypothetical protein [Escherichia coli]